MVYAPRSRKRRKHAQPRTARKVVNNCLWPSSQLAGIFFRKPFSICFQTQQFSNDHEGKNARGTFLGSITTHCVYNSDHCPFPYRNPDCIPRISCHPLNNSRNLSSKEWPISQDCISRRVVLLNLQSQYLSRSSPD